MPASGRAVVQFESGLTFALKWVARLRANRSASTWENACSRKPYNRGPPLGNLRLCAAPPPCGFYLLAVGIFSAHGRWRVAPPRLLRRIFSQGSREVGHSLDVSLCLRHHGSSIDGCPGDQLAEWRTCERFEDAEVEAKEIVGLLGCPDVHWPKYSAFTHVASEGAACTPGAIVFGHPGASGFLW